MGRVIEKLIIGFRCELKSCDEMRDIFPPLEATALWEDQLEELTQMINDGWGAVLAPQMRTYCPKHVSHVHKCTCVTQPTRKHLCVQHGVETAELVWTRGSVPASVLKEIERGILL